MARNKKYVPEPFMRDGFAYTPNDDGEGYRIHCDQCAACVIQGTPCHETGCPNKPYPGNHYGAEADDFEGEEN